MKDNPREKREGNKKEITRKERGLGMKDKRITRRRQIIGRRMTVIKPPTDDT